MDTWGNTGVGQILQFLYQTFKYDQTKQVQKGFIVTTGIYQWIALTRYSLTSNTQTSVDLSIECEIGLKNKWFDHIT